MARDSISAEAEDSGASKVPRGETGSWRVAVGLPIVAVALPLWLAERYGYNGDELYFLACGRRLAFGYVDHAPLVPWIARISSELFGDGLHALRLAPALARGLAVLLAVLLVRRWGGRTFAQLVAGLAVLVAPAFLRMGSVLCIPVFEPLFWTGCSYLVVRAIDERRPRLWLAVGALAGLGLLNKHTMLLWGAGLVVGLLATPARVELSRPWPWLGGLVALAIFLPNLIWQHQNDLRAPRSRSSMECPRPTCASCSPTCVWKRRSLIHWRAPGNPTCLSTSVVTHVSRSPSCGPS